MSLKETAVCMSAYAELSSTTCCHLSSCHKTQWLNSSLAMVAEFAGIQLNLAEATFVLKNRYTVSPLFGSLAAQTDGACNMHLLYLFEVFHIAAAQVLRMPIFAALYLHTTKV